jgi:serine phosphatase RsbU (regulator of sigma subunit)
MAVPLFDNTNVLGLLYADSNDIRTTFTKEHLEVLTLLANMAAVKITNARLLDAEQERQRMIQELATATGIQQSLLPPTPEVEGYQIKAFLQTCHEVGGDLYDFNLNSDGTLYFLLGDVSGKGLGAAMLMSSVMASARVLFDTCPDPVDLVTRLNGIVHRSTNPDHFLTAFLGRLDPRSGRLDYVNAGHNPPYIVAGDAIRELEATGIPLGMMPQFPYSAGTAELPHRSLFALFTDGIPEANREGEFFEEERLKEVLLSAGSPEVEDVCQKIISSVDDFLSGQPRLDDLTLLLIRRK